MSRKDKQLNAEPDLFSELEPPPAPVAQPPETASCWPDHLAEVAVEGPLRGTFTYSAGELWTQLVPGARVLVPFGPRSVVGFFLGEKTADELKREGVNPAKIKPIIRVLDAASENPQTLLTPTLLQLSKWISRHYAAPLGATLSSMLPAGVKKGASGARVRMIEAVVAPEVLVAKANELTAKKPKQAALLLALAATGGAVDAPALLEEAEAPDSALKALAKAGLLRITEERVDERDKDEERSHDLVLNTEQQAALEKIECALKPFSPEALAAGSKAASGTRQDITAGFLLQGVTGSGKTEVYIRALKTALELGRQGIVLVPEIALTPQTAQRFESRLGRDRIAVLHSHITDGERAEAWRDVRAGKIDVVVGARSALFAPLPRLGIIIIDEEHETAFKQESTPRYTARDVAMELSRLTGAVLILGSATPSFEALHAARTEKLSHLFLTQRIAGRPMPPVEIVDMNRENLEAKKYSFLSRRLLQGLDQTLARGEQAILFMNRRGFATVITCLRCGFTEKCTQCDITLTSHRGATAAPSGHVHGETLSCHYCGFTKPVPDACSSCGSPGVKHWGMGTERIENEVSRAFPNARVARMDSDTMSQRTSYLEALGNFRAGKTDILVGTQMIAKGLDFPNVTLVGVVLADTALHMPDFRSRERTFQLLAQVAGRAGRSDKGGRVIIQTHLPDDPAIRAVVHHDFETFSLKELQERRTYSYPPFTRLVRILIRGKDPKATREAAEKVADTLRAEKVAGVTILGPAEPPINKLEGYYRQHILIKAATNEMLSELLGGAAGDVIAKLKGADAVVDVDPLAML